MAKLVLTDAFVSLGGTTISSSVAAVTVTVTAAEVETTAMGAGGVTRVGGLRDDSITLSCHNDYSAIDGLFYPLIGSTAAIIVKPNGTTTSSSNPAFTGTVLITEYSPVNGAVGELNTFDITFPVSGTLTRTV